MPILKPQLKALQARLAETIGNDLASARSRRAAWWHFQLMDHAFLRVWWKNLDQVGPGVWRSNQPAPADLERMAAQGLKTVLNLRGRTGLSAWLFEKETCDRLGLKLIDLQMSAKQPPEREKLLELMTVFDIAEMPMLMHCKSGADRTGLASAIWLMEKQGQTAAEAGRQLSFRYLHMKREKAGVQDQILRNFAAEGEARGLSFRDWVATTYDPARVRADFQRFLDGGGKGGDGKGGGGKGGGGRDGARKGGS